MKDIYDLADDLREFAEERDWNQYHMPKNLVMALSVEVSELMEHFMWLDCLDHPSGKEALIQDEVADMFIYLVRLADVMGIELLPAAFEKIEKNKVKYPAERVKGRADKYTEYDLIP